MEKITRDDVLGLTESILLLAKSVNNLSSRVHENTVYSGPDDLITFNPNTKEGAEDDASR